VSARDLVDKLALQPHPEGGWYREIYRSPTRVETPRGSRSAITTIYYLLERHQLSRWHVVQADELWHFYAGAPLELLEYDSTARKLQRHMLGHVDSTPGASADATAWPAGAAATVASGGITKAGAGASADATAWPAGVGAAVAFGATTSGSAGATVAAGDSASAAGSSGAVSVAVIRSGVWQAARSLGDYSLVGCTVGPGFEFADFQFTADLPSHAEHFKGALAPFAHLL